MAASGSFFHLPCNNKEVVAASDTNIQQGIRACTLYSRCCTNRDDFRVPKIIFDVPSTSDYFRIFADRTVRGVDGNYRNKPYRCCRSTSSDRAEKIRRSEADSWSNVWIGIFDLFRGDSVGGAFADLNCPGHSFLPISEAFCLGAICLLAVSSAELALPFSTASGIVSASPYVSIGNRCYTVLNYLNVRYFMWQCKMCLFDF